MPAPRSCLSIALLSFGFLLLGASCAQAEFHYYDDGPISTPRIGTGLAARPEYPSAVGSTAGDPANLHPPIPGFGRDGYGPPPTSYTSDGTFVPRPSYNDQGLYHTGPMADHSILESGIEDALAWSAEMAGASSYPRASQNGMPRATMVTMRDRKESGEKR